MRVCINNEMAHFSRFLQSHYVHIPYIHACFSNFSSCGTIFLFLCAQVTRRHVECSIARFNIDHHLSEGVCSALSFAGESF